MTAKSITHGYALLRNRAVLREADLADRQLEKALKRRDGKAVGERPNVGHLDPLTMPANVAEYVTKHGGYLPPVNRGSPSDSASKEAYLLGLDAEFGRQVLLTYLRPQYDHLPLKSLACRDGAKRDTIAMLYLHARLALKHGYSAAIQRGDVHQSTHTHVCLALAHLSPKHREAVLNSPAGPGGGVWLIPGVLYAVMLDDDPRSIPNVASYLARDADGRYDLPYDHPAYLQAVSEDLARGKRSPRMSW